MADEVRIVRGFVAAQIGRLLKSENESAVRATLANLRRGIGKPPGSMAELWSVTLRDMPEELYSRTGVPTRGEWASYIALTMFALHQQGKELKRQPMNAEGVSLGTAVRRLVREDEGEERVKRRFDAVITAGSIEEAAHHLRGLIQLLKSEDIALDYSMLAVDLYFFQSETARDGVRLRWGQDFYRRADKHSDGADAEDTTNDK